MALTGMTRWLGRTDPRAAGKLVAGGTPTYFLAAFLFFFGFALFYGPLPAYLTALEHSSGTISLPFIVAGSGSALIYGRVTRFTPATSIDVVHAGSLAVRGLLFPAVLLAGGRRTSRNSPWCSPSWASRGRSSPSPVPGWSPD